MSIIKRFRIFFFYTPLLFLLFGTFFIAKAQEELYSWESLRNRPYPQWFKDAKLGIFIHWGVYSVPAYGGAESYAEWYLRGLQTGAQNRLDFMKKNWGEDFEYKDFATLFKAELFDPDEWAAIFKAAGAKYIILVAKHHDGYCLWPSKFAPDWNSVDVGPHRDIVGELAKAVKKQEIHFGLYYSLPEWNNPLHRWYIDPHDSIHNYIAQHMIPQFKELVEIYRPEVLFTDGEWFHTAEDWHARELIGWYYNLLGPEAIVNDRWGHGADIGFITPEYSAGGLKTNRPWSEVRGLGRSFGLNRNEKLEAYMNSKELIHFFIRTVANGGGITINVGPAADGKIPLLQEERLRQLGEWISINEEAVYAAKPWKRSGEEKRIFHHRIDTAIHFNWVRNSPAAEIAEDHFDVVWSGYIKAPFSETFTFSAEADDGIRIYIDNQLVVDQWDAAVEGTDSEAMRESIQREAFAELKLKKDTYYPIRVEYREVLQNASVSLFWSSKSMSQQIVAGKYLFTTAAEPFQNGLMASYTSMKQTIAYTYNNGNLYVTCLEWPGDELRLPIEEPHDATIISMLGRDGNLPWRFEQQELVIDLKSIRYNEMPGHDAWTFRIKNLGHE